MEKTNIQISENQKEIEKAIEELQTLMRIDEMASQIFIVSRNKDNAKAISGILERFS